LSQFYGGSPTVSPRTAAKQGYLTKEGEVFKTWKHRHFTLDGSFFYYAKKPVRALELMIRILTIHELNRNLGYKFHFFLFFYYYYYFVVLCYANRITLSRYNCCTDWFISLFFLLDSTHLSQDKPAIKMIPISEILEVTALEKYKGKLYCFAVKTPHRTFYVSVWNLPLS
jgi:hypothetical protein